MGNEKGFSHEGHEFGRDSHSLPLKRRAAQPEHDAVARRGSLRAISRCAQDAPLRCGGGRANLAVKKFADRAACLTYAAPRRQGRRECAAPL